MTMRERIARALAQYRFGADGSWEDMLPWADAVLAAIREPTEAMQDAAHGAELDIYWNYRADGSPGEAKDVWQAMIDAAITEGKT